MAPSGQPPTYKRILAQLLRNDFSAFMTWAWPHVDPAEQQHGWHLDLMAEYLQAFAYGEIPKLLINVPPGHQKSLSVSVMLPAWVWTWQPSARFLATAYSGNLALRDADRARLLIRSYAYQELFGELCQLRPGQDTKGRYENNHKGYRFSAAVAGIMGEGGDFVILDDPHNIAQAESDDVRNETVRQINLALPTRVRNPKGGVACIMQRLHSNDYAASMIGDPQTIHLCLPARYEENHPHVSRPITLPSGRVLGGDHRTKDGELLFPALFNEERLAALEERLLDYGTAGQLQQRPTPREGGLFKRAWLEKFVSKSQLNPRRLLVRGWDLASSDKPRSPYSAGVLISKDVGVYTVEDVVRERGLPGDIRQLILRTAKSDGPGVVQDFPQDPGQAGKSQVVSLARDLAGYNMRSSPESGSKIQRAEIVASQCQHGQFQLVRAAWNAAYIDEMAGFWTGPYSDQVDGTSRSFARLVTMGGRVRSGVAHGSY